MSVDFEKIKDVPRLLMEVELKPLQGARFQPTGFPDLGAATYTLPSNNTEMLLVESAQSMANRMEAICWNGPKQKPIEPLKGLPYVRVNMGQDRFLTSSWLEAHRLASAFIKDSVGPENQGMVDFFRREFALRKNMPIDWSLIYKKVFALDPMCLIHGVFFADKKWPGQPRVCRALSAFIEAADVRPVESGGVKKDEVSHKTGEGQRATEGYGHVPYHRREFTAGNITAFFNLNLAQIRSYGLSEEATRLLILVGLFKIRRWLDSEMDLRTNCKFKPCNDVVVKAPPGFALPALGDLEGEVRQAVELCARGREFGATPTVVVWNPKPISVDLLEGIGKVEIPEDLKEQCRVEKRKVKGREKRLIQFTGPVDEADIEALKDANPGAEALHKVFDDLLKEYGKQYQQEKEKAEEGTE